MTIPSANCVLIGACVAFLGCTGPYQPVLELWPTSDASSAGASALQNSSSSSSGGSSSSGSDDSGATSPTPTATSSPTGGSSGGPPTNVPDAAQNSSGGSSGGPIDAGTVNPVPDSGTGGFDGGSQTNGACNLSVTVTTVTDNGGYSPENVGAIWIANSSGTFVKTLERWAQSRISHLTLWNSATSAAGLSRNTVDAITSASLSSYKTHTVSWNCTDAKRAVVPDGAYRVYFETTDDNVTGPNAYVNFTKGPMGFNSSPAGTTYFTNIKLAFTP